MMTGKLDDQNAERQVERQMGGCMSGFLQLFERNQLLTVKRLYATKRLPPAPVAEATTPEPEESTGSPASLRESDSTIYTEKPPPPKSPLPLPMIELREGTRSSWKFCKEAPRLSLDSRATVDAKGSLQPKLVRTDVAPVLPVSRCDNNEDGAAANVDDKQHRSPSVIARLMGLEPLPSSSPEHGVKKAELRRSASESRVSRDLFQCRFMESNSNTQLQTCVTSGSMTSNVNMRYNVASLNTTAALCRPLDPSRNASKAPNSELSDASTWKHYHNQQRKSFFDSADIYPDPKKTAVSIYGEIEKRLKMRGINGPSKDLETLKQILEALQLKGLLHSTRTSSPADQISHKNFVYDRNYCFDESPVVVMKASRTPISAINRRNGNESPPCKFRNNKPGVRPHLSLAGEALPSISPRRERHVMDRNAGSPHRVRNETSVKSTNSIAKPKSLSIERQQRRKVNEATEQRRVSALHSPKLSAKRFESDQNQTSSRSPRTRKATGGGDVYVSPKEKITTVVVTDDESSSISESTINSSTSSQTDTELQKWKVEEYKEGRSLLDRCDKLLHSIAEMNTISNDMQPSPVSVLDSSSFDKDDSSSPSPSPSPVLKSSSSSSSSIDFKPDQSDELEDEVWSPALSPMQSKEDSDYIYISSILRASHYLPEDSDIFLLLEKQQHLNGKDTSKVSRLQRKLIFDTITEILDRNRQLPPWKLYTGAANNGTTKPLLQQIWSEFQRIREHDMANDLYQVICGVLKKDLAGDAINGWGDCPLETSEVVLDIERLIFKDLVGEAIRDLAALAGKCTFLPPRRKLIF